MNFQQDFTRSKALNQIPNRKVLLKIKEAEQNESLSVEEKNLIKIMYNRYAECNIPVEYWTLKMEDHFKGDARLLKKYQEYVQDLQASYVNGSSFCLAGSHGTGKTMTSVSILKKASQKGYNCLYTTLSDIVSVLISASNEEKFLARRELTMVDFLVIDEFDSRFAPTENASDLYARSLESVFRTRAQNKLPTLMCTNSPNIVESLNGSLKQSIESLFKGYLPVFAVLGEDFRKKAK